MKTGFARIAAFGVAAALLAGCAGTGPQLLVDPHSSPLRVRAHAGSVMLREISLPAYAQATEISLRTDKGALVEQKGQVWADEPARAMMGALVRNIAVITGAEVAAEPWPLAGYPDVEVTIRVEHMFARADGSVALAGYTAIRRETGPSAIRQFDIARPADPDAADDLAAAYEAAWTELAETIARQL